MTGNGNKRHDWTVTGMDCASCATKITTALERLPGVAEVQVGVMSEKLSLVLAAEATSRETIEATVKKLGYGIAPKGEATAKRKFAMPVPPKANDHGPDHAQDNNATPSEAQDAGHGNPGHDHGSNPADRDKPWYATGKGKLVIGTGLLLTAAWAVKMLASEQVALWAFVVACLIGVAPIARRASSVSSL